MFIVPLLQHLLHSLISVTHLTSVKCLKMSERNWSVSKWSTHIILISPFTPPHVTLGPGVISPPLFNNNITFSLINPFTVTERGVGLLSHLDYSTLHLILTYSNHLSHPLQHSPYLHLVVSVTPPILSCKRGHKTLLGIANQLHLMYPHH